jgi:tetratricopeptide (TPR) repeat protein
MTEQVRKFRWLAGASLLGGSLIFGITGVAISAVEGNLPPAPANPLYLEECGACHLAYPAGLLPDSSWQKMMGGLEDHFGDNAELDAATAAELSVYLAKYSLREGQPTRFSRMLRNMPEEPPLRITDTPYMAQAHQSIADTLGMEQLDEGFLSPCADCHKQADQGVFDKDLIYQGYGPGVETPSTTPAETSPEIRAVIVPGSGTYSRKISTTSPQTQQFFDQGLRFSWGFFFPESIASYQQAALTDPGHPMPYWGMAQAMGPNPNSRYARMPDDPQGEGLKAIRMALDRIDRATALEAKLINALYVLYNKEAIPDDAERDRAYLAQMRALNTEYPDDGDIAALYAASYMSIARWNYWDIEGQPLAETLPVALALEHIMEDNLLNPGVLHLHIHLVESSLTPERALISAEALEETVPIAGHVVHMPSHIYVRVGQYDRAIDSNVRSQARDKEFAKIWGDLPLPNLGTYPLSHKIHAGHALDFIRYSATIQGNYEVAIEAARALKKRSMGSHAGMRGFEKNMASPWHLDKIFGQWNLLIGSTPSHTDTPYLQGMWAYSLGSALANTGDTDGAGEQLAILRTILAAPNVNETVVSVTPVSDLLTIAAYGLEGEILQAGGDLERAISAFEAAVALEDLSNYTEPPAWAQPMRHYLGAALLAAGRAREAEHVYRRDLRWNAENGWSLFGLYQSYADQGKQAEADATFARYQQAWQHSDTALSGSRM